MHNTLNAVFMTPLVTPHEPGPRSPKTNPQRKECKTISSHRQPRTLSRVGVVRPCSHLLFLFKGSCRISQQPSQIPEKRLPVNHVSNDKNERNRNNGQNTNNDRSNYDSTRNNTNNERKSAYIIMITIQAIITLQTRIVTMVTTSI